MKIDEVTLTEMGELVYRDLRGAQLLDAEPTQDDEQLFVLWADGLYKAGTHRALVVYQKILLFGDYYDGEHAVLRAAEGFRERAKLEVTA